MREIELQPRIIRTQSDRAVKAFHGSFMGVRAGECVYYAKNADGVPVIGIETDNCFAFIYRRIMLAAHPVDRRQESASGLIVGINPNTCACGFRSFGS